MNKSNGSLLLTYRIIIFGLRKSSERIERVTSFEVYFELSTALWSNTSFCIYWLWFICLKFGLRGLKCFALEAFWHPLLGHYCRYRRRQAQINWRNDYEDGFSQLPWIIHFWSRVQIRNNKSWTTSAHDIHKRSWGAILKGKCKEPFSKSHP